MYGATLAVELPLKLRDYLASEPKYEGKEKTIQSIQRVCRPTVHTTFTHPEELPLTHARIYMLGSGKDHREETLQI